MKRKYLYDEDTKDVHANAAYTKQLIRVTEKGSDEDGG
jgi:hypothetical protein